MRVFIAVPIPIYLMDPLILSLNTIKVLDKHRQVRWIAEEYCHLTIAFIGNLENEQIRSIWEDINTKLLGTPVFKYRIISISPFPFSKKPRVIAAILESNEKLKSLKTQIDSVLSTHQIKVDDKKYRPHITLGRFNKYSSSPLNLPSVPMKLDSVADRIAVYQSILKPTGAEYFPLYEKRLE